LRPVPRGPPGAGPRAVPDDPGDHVGVRLLQCVDACPGRVGQHAHRPGAVDHRRRARVRGDLAGLPRAARWSAGMKRSHRSVVLAFATVLAACGEEPRPLQYGADPELPQPRRGLLPDMTVAEPVAWGERKPTVPQGYVISAIATELQIPRQTLLLPNGDILVAEGRGGNAPSLKPKDVIAGYIKAKGTSPVEAGNRLTLLRDADGDGVYELRTVFAENLNAPYGLALVDGNLYVANQDALVRFAYREGQTSADGPPVKVTDLPSAINH